MDTKKVEVEFTSISRMLTGRREAVLDLEKNATIGDVVKALGEAYPQLLGAIIEKDGRSLIPSNVFSVNGERIIHESDMQYQPADGERLILLSLLAGG